MRAIECRASRAWHFEAMNSLARCRAIGSVDDVSTFKRYASKRKEMACQTAESKWMIKYRYVSIGAKLSQMILVSN